jgi:hypothetical protein
MLSSDIVEWIKHLKASLTEIGHPLLLPLIIFSHGQSDKNDIKQREARYWLHALEHGLSMRTEIGDDESYFDKDGNVNFGLINRHLVECNSQVLWKPPEASLDVLERLEDIGSKYIQRLCNIHSKRYNETIRDIHEAFTARIELYRVKLKGARNYARRSLQRIEAQRSAVRTRDFSIISGHQALTRTAAAPDRVHSG